MTATPALLSIQIGLPGHFGRADADDPMESEWETGFYKSPVAGPIHLGTTNLEGDGQADLVNHGGADKAVCCYPAAHYDAWRVELDLPDMPFGGFGENFTIAGLSEPDVCIGDTWRAGDVLVQVSQPRQPCWKVARRWKINDLTAQVVHTGRTGWYFRVLTEGPIAPGTALVLEDRPHPDWTVERANQVMYRDRHDFASMAELAAVPPLSASWKQTLRGRMARETQRGAT